jgi:hypothetical protein
MSSPSISVIKENEKGDRLLLSHEKGDRLLLSKNRARPHFPALTSGKAASPLFIQKK